MEGFDTKALKQAFKSMTGNDDVEFIGKDDYFDFQCQRCGQCCMNRDDIIINPFDVFNGARYLGIETEEFIKNYTQMHIGDGSKLPVVCLKSDPNNHGWCPLLELDILAGAKFKCKIDKAKPGACRNHPIGRVSGYQKNDDGVEVLEEQYVKVGQCPQSQGHNVMNKVSDWVANTLETPEDRNAAHNLQIGMWSEKKFNLPRLYRIFEMFSRLAETMNERKENLRDDINEKFGEEISEDEFNEVTDKAEEMLHMATSAAGMMYELIFTTTYFGYDINKPFVEQADEKRKKLQKEIPHFFQLGDALYDILIQQGSPEIQDKMRDYIEKGVLPNGDND